MKQTNPCDDLYAVIDIGSNTLRLLIGCIKDNKLIRLKISRAVTRLGKNINHTYELNNENIEKSISSLIKFQLLYEKYTVKKVLAVGTSALREAKNSVNFLSEVKKKTGIDIEIISGEKEAELTLKGVLTCIDKKSNPLNDNRFFIIDIGGGSTEWILQSQQTIKGSIPIGAVKLFERFIIDDPPKITQIIQLKDYILSELLKSGLKEIINDKVIPNNIKFIATGGTPTTIAAIDLQLSEYNGDAIHLHKIHRPTLQLILERLYQATLNNRKKIVGLESERADIIITGTSILLSFMETLDFNELIVSDFGLLEGLLMSVAYDK